jgi:hypothetical protein
MSAFAKPVCVQDISGEASHCAVNALFRSYLARLLPFLSWETAAFHGAIGLDEL